MKMHDNTQTKKNKLESLHQLDQEIARRRQELREILEEKTTVQRVLNDTQSLHQKVINKISEYNSQLELVSQKAFLMSTELDKLLQLKERIKNRADQATQKKKEELLAQSYQPETLDEYGLKGQPQRNNKRAPVAIDINYSSENNFYVGFSENISNGGIFVATYQPLAVGQRFWIEFILPEVPDPIICMVEVAWAKEYTGEDDIPDQSPPGMGLKFVSIDGKDQDKISLFVARRQPLFFPEADEA